MRFEIRTGGMMLILAGLAVLSGSVFALGLIAGYEMSRQNQIDQSQLASVYPAPSPLAMPTTVPPPREAALPAPSPAIIPVRPPAGAVAAAKPMSEEPIPPPPVEAPPPPPPGEENPDAISAPGPAASTPAPPSGGGPLASTGGAVTSAANAVPVKRRPFNIQIDAVMDYSGAQQMAQRLRQLGYQPTIVQTDIAGQKWYRLRVGPYATAEEARAAQDRLRQQYKSAFGAN